MTPARDDTIVRRHERHRCEIPVELRLGTVSARRVELVRGVCGPEGQFPGFMVDVSHGGVGLRTKVFIPRTCQLLLRVGEPASPGGRALFEGPVRVQRVTMMDRAVQYYLGCSWDESGVTGPQLDRLIEAAKAAPPVDAKEAHGAR